MSGKDWISWYTVYNAKTDEIVACGTADMIVRQMGYVNKNSLYSAVTHSKTRKGPPRLYIYHVQKVRREELEKEGMKIIIEEHEDTVSVSYIGKGKKIDRLLLLTLATAETVVDCLIPNLPDKKVREAADCFADDMKAVIISAYEDKASDHKSKLTSKEATFLSKLMGL